MTSILTIVGPVFAIIALGLVAARTEYLSEATGKGIADFAFLISIPALLFRTVLTARFEGVAPFGVMASFFGAAAIVWVASTVVTALLKRPAQDAPSIAMSAVFGNTVMLGLPIGVSAFGSEAMAPISVILGIHAPVFLTAATLHTALVETRDGEGALDALRSIGRQLATQPLIVAIAAGTILRVTGIGVPDVLMAVVDMLAKAGVPAALLSLGMSLKAFRIKGDTATVAALIGLKLVAMPALAALLAYEVFGLPRISAEVVALMSALPAGANSYLFAVKSGRAVNSASGAVALGTALSAITLSFVIAWARVAP